MPIVYLLHADRPTAAGWRHYLGVAAAEADVSTATARHASGHRQLPAGMAIADVWECASPAEADALRAKLARQGSRAGMCSICTPGNARGLGRGRWDRQGRKATISGG